MKTMNRPLAEPPKMYETENDISEKRRSELNALMNQRLASAVDLQTQMKQAHWNVKGPSFIGLHELFDQVDEAVESYVDMIAERIVQLGGIAEGTARVAASRSQLEEVSAHDCRRLGPRRSSCARPLHLRTRSPRHDQRSRRTG